VTVLKLNQQWTGRYAVIGCKLKQNANEGCSSCARLAGLVLSFIACFILLVIAPLDNTVDVFRACVSTGFCVRQNT